MMKKGPDNPLLETFTGDGDPARAYMLAALIGGQAFTARELASEAGITVQTARSHLADLEQGGILRRRKQGQHRYFAVVNDDVGAQIEAIIGPAVRSGGLRKPTGPADPALRRARVCYNHLAGEMGVRLFDSMVARHLITDDCDTLALTDDGRRFAESLEIDLPNLTSAGRPLCKACLDWSGRRSHLAGPLGAALLNRFYRVKWAARETGTRVVRFTRAGEKNFMRHFPVD